MDLVTFTEKVLNVKLHFLCSGRKSKRRGVPRTMRQTYDSRFLLEPKKGYECQVFWTIQKEKIFVIGVYLFFKVVLFAFLVFLT